jgi:glutaredoxin
MERCRIMTVELYTLGDCPRCHELARLLTSLSVPFDTLPLDNAENLTELQTNGVFVTEAPVLRIGDIWLGPGQLFPGGYLDIEQITGFIGEDGHV